MPAALVRWLTVLAAVLATAGAVFLTPPAAALALARGEAESGRITPATSGAFVDDLTAGGGRSAEIWDSGSLEVDITTTAPASAVLARVRQELCGPESAFMRIKVDGVFAQNTYVDSTTWVTIPFRGNWAAGRHTVQIEFGHPYYDASTCGARELFVDHVAFATAVAGTTYYVDAVDGDDANPGTSPDAAWESIAQVNGAVLAPGDKVLFNRGQTFTGATLSADQPGDTSARVTYGAYGTGAPPILDGAGLRYPMTIDAPFVAVEDLHVRNAGGEFKIGLQVSGADAFVQRLTASGNAIGVQAESDRGHRLRLTESNLVDNRTVINPDGKGKAEGSTDDYGASGVVVLKAHGVEIDHNTMRGNIGPSADFGQDGSAVEIYGAVGTVVHYNRSVDNHTFSELGNAATRNTTFHDNLITAHAGIDDAVGFNAQGTGTFGPVLGTRMFHNTVALLGPSSKGVVVGAGATAFLHNNIVQAAYAGYSGAQKIDEGHNVWQPGAWGNDIWSDANPGQGIAPTSVTADPLFVGPGDYRLQAGSPARNRGVSAYGAALSLGGTARDATIDAGAY
ncbi:carbohydrate-binding domain-containing protein [Actinoplanes sp. NPDC023936]|uniref:carbohydrate-binding domain-containing protein n=1 Tax=Actinoplanes sp. NPDC023936 TaxID=3154910 RepID=UPI0033F39B2F